MTDFTDRLWNDLASEYGEALVHADRPRPGRFRRARLVAGGAFTAAAGAATALALTLTTATATPAFAITRNSDGSVQVRLNAGKAQAAYLANQRLTAMKVGKSIVGAFAAGKAAGKTDKMITCKPQSVPGESGPKVVTVLTPDQIEKVAATDSNTHLIACFIITLHRGVVNIK
jgi:hypothetical protein